ncbi:MAG: TIGR04282 family arsenosugar biosynthesis glycosyltransferase [Synechococcaceae cyanobacterium]|nr:TIGR04282 family arsenosugar biosynthesis glycosyltransferase [Synechococcaceae cyanobacterium]
MSNLGDAQITRLQVVVLARWPAPGRCKSRLAEGIGRVRAAAVQARLARHVTAVARESLNRLRALAEAPDAELVLAVDGLGSRAARRWGRELGVDRVVLQGGGGLGSGGLGSRLQRQLLRAHREGARRIILVGSDLPSLEPSDLVDAFEALETAPWVLGPAQDGGYWLIGAKRPQPSPFVGPDAPIPWGTAAVLHSTLRLAARHGISVPLLKRQADLDLPTDLRRWR